MKAPCKPLPGNTLAGSEHNQGSVIAARILSLAADGLKVRDISSLLHIHPMIVVRTLSDAVSGYGGAISGPLPAATDALAMRKKFPSLI